MQWTHVQPVTLVFGAGKIRELGQIAANNGLENGLLVCDPFFAQNGFAEQVKALGGGAIAAIFSQVCANPTLQNVDDCADVIRRGNHGFVVALGGGSALDCAKAAATIALDEYPAREYHEGKRHVGKRSLPLIAVPTTAGTGSEVTAVAVLTDAERGVKAPLGSPNFYPKVAVIDPELTISVPPQVTASTGLDVLCHALEGYWSVNHQPVCDAVALRALELVFEYLPVAYKDGANMLAREKMCEASVLAGIAFAFPKTTGSHACSYPLTALYHMPHGEACAFTIDAFLRINKDAQEGRVRDCAKKLGFADPDEMADRILRMKREMGMKTTLQEAGIPPEAVRDLAERSVHPNLYNNPVEMSVDDLEALYRSLV